VRPIHQISPMARQNISWAARITHQCSVQQASDGADNNENNPLHLPDFLDRIVGQIWESLPHESIPLAATDAGFLRVDAYPRSFAEQICLGLQTACAKYLAAKNTQPMQIPSDPFEGPISMTMSASKCTQRLTVIISEKESEKNNCDNSLSTRFNVHWGLMDRESDAAIMNMKFNHQANEEIKIVSPDPETGGEVKPGIPIEAPLSRAYYKLDQVWNEYLEPQQTTLSRIQHLEASAVDFGAAPGGWLQVLAHRAKGLKSVCSVDRGKVADRVANLPHVHQIHGILEDSQEKIEPYGPFAIVTCDASKLWSDVVKWFTEIVVHKSPTLKKDGKTDLENQVESPKFTLPCIFVITMKLPFKTFGSIQRHVNLLHEKLPQYLSGMVAAMYPHIPQPVQTRSTIAHLMANSDSERTLIILFEEA
jgi:hypothetical protein